MPKPLDYRPPHDPEREPPQFWVFFVIVGVILLAIGLLYWLFRVLGA
jgi:hypothetical protein